MNPRSLKIFEKKKGIHISPENIVAISWTIVIFLIYFLKATYEFNFEGWETGILIFGTIYIIGLMISTFFRYEREIGKYSGKLTFWKDRIQIGNKEYKIEQINKIEFNAYDIKGTFVNSMLEFSPHLSNGLNNQFSLILKNGEKIKCNFLQTESEKIEFFNEIFIYYYKKGIISWLKLLEILNIEDYNEIQKFKKEITIANTVQN
ncbi:hypothetical protein K8354_16210 [Polaribacter litorisediminis]|uniref:hypothetical protein n=1 Tax=Polaribacter litorisediminis TaxID=1908341 RepID=UPI001CBD3380|nr:hypothetical protein [Polaribacter litorisediminis]UAM97814.1 hypothetical protein K8354_16210 [Polaribacter litorisediminis]